MSLSNWGGNNNNNVSGDRPLLPFPQPRAAATERWVPALPLSLLTAASWCRTSGDSKRAAYIESFLYGRYGRYKMAEHQRYFSSLRAPAPATEETARAVGSLIQEAANKIRRFNVELADALLHVDAQLGTGRSSKEEKAVQVELSDQLGTERSSKEEKAVQVEWNDMQKGLVTGCVATLRAMCTVTAVWYWFRKGK